MSSFWISSKRNSQCCQVLKFFWNFKDFSFLQRFYNFVIKFLDFPKNWRYFQYLSGCSKNCQKTWEYHIFHISVAKNHEKLFRLLVECTSKIDENILVGKTEDWWLMVIYNSHTIRSFWVRITWHRISPPPLHLLKNQNLNFKFFYMITIFFIVSLSRTIVLIIF